MKRGTTFKIVLDERWIRKDDKTLGELLAGCDPYKEDTPISFLYRDQEGNVKKVNPEDFDEAGQWQKPDKEYDLYEKGLWKQLPPESILPWSKPKEFNDLNEETPAE